MHGDPLATVQIRQSNSDFKVYELPPCVPDGAGEHIWVHVRKDGCNTDWVAEQLARVAKVKVRDVSYAGRKDRHAICEQWFSVHYPGLETPELISDCDEFEILSQARHGRKLRTGGLKGNRFEIVMRPTSGVIDPAVLNQRISDIIEKGVPNFFGEQRFGSDMSNLRQVERWVAGGSLPRSRNRRSLTISAARSWLFNLVVAGRLRKNQTDLLVNGDYCVVAGRHSGFTVDGVTDGQITQVANGEIEISAPLIGEEISSDYLELYIDLSAETYVSQWCTKLACIQMSTDWRPIRLMLRQLTVQNNNDGSVSLEFSLPAGAFATSVIREIANLTDSQLFDSVNV
ncbi:MAG: tRNA pseudouridine13 synthase [Pseudoalteromonas tetraodonis]|jgi:tRNA pseudouridine13 synthase